MIPDLVSQSGLIGLLAALGVVFDGHQGCFADHTIDEAGRAPAY